MKKRVVFFGFLAVIILLANCSLFRQVSPTGSSDGARPLSPAESILAMQVEDGFEVMLVASEPLITAPVAITFDERGRLWAVEMNGYMPDTAGVGEDKPTGKIVLLEDRNSDGRMDTRKVIIDSLRLPRAICLIENGLLVAEPPGLWYYPLINDKPGKRELVDEKYIEGGNVEHSPNGLFRAIDNWIYNAKSAKRYRKAGDKWLIEKTHFRGQWGIAQDNYGRLYYNDNTSNLSGDYFSPGLGASNANQKSVEGFGKRIVADTRVYPAHATPGVNRGYTPGILDDSLRLVRFTAACAPLIYRGDLLGPSFQFNAFVAEPSGNLVKRNILDPAIPVTGGRQAYTGTEFISSTDERFRPVNLHNGPDGALYIVDMYRGIIQHETYLTPYLKQQIAVRRLTLPQNCGRIYKVVRKKLKSRPVKFPAGAVAMARLLGHPNGWVRDKAQQLLIDGKRKEVAGLLRNNLESSADPLLIIHSFWTLEGLGELAAENVISLVKHKSWPVRMQGLAALPGTMNRSNYKLLMGEAGRLVAQNDTLAATFLAYGFERMASFDSLAAKQLLQTIALKFADDNFTADAVISVSGGREEALQRTLLSNGISRTSALNRQLQRIISANMAALANRDPAIVAKEFPKGALLYTNLCQTCHGPDGEGRPNLGPPLNRSEWVNGAKDQLAAIVLVGLTGPVSVNGKVYGPPEINGDMPGIGASKEFTDDDIAQVLSFIRRSWLNNAAAVEAKDIAASRQKLRGRQKAFTAREIKNW